MRHLEAGHGEILGICEGAKENKSGWSAFLRHLVERGLKGVRLIISDACRGLTESAAEYLPESRWQRCMCIFIGTYSATFQRQSPRGEPYAQAMPRRAGTRPTARRARSSTTCAPPG